jgi:PIN domain nuclease of toxin-antitoxin system
MKLLLDTHGRQWWPNEPSRLSEPAHEAISDLDNEIFLSVVNGWEIQIKAQLDKLTLSKPLSVILEQEQETNDFRLLPVTMAHVLALDIFPLHHRDPFDRLLVAQAHQEEMTLVTHDLKLSAYSVSLLW